MMQAAHERELDHRLLVRSHDRPWDWAVLRQRPVSARLVIVIEVLLEHAAEIPRCLRTGRGVVLPLVRPKQKGRATRMGAALH